MNNHGCFGHRAFVKFTDVYDILSDFEDKMEVEFTKIVEQHTSRCVPTSQDKVYRSMAKALNSQGELLYTLTKKDENLK